MIIGLSGKIGSGKNTVARIIQGLNMSIDYDILRHHIKQEEDFDSSCGWEIKAFADKLKEIVSLLTGIPRKDLDKTEVKNSLLGEEWIRYGYADGFYQSSKGTIMNNITCSKERYEQELKTNWQTAYKHQYTVRELLQLVGTDAMRNIIHNDIWINALFADYKVIDDNCCNRPDICLDGDGYNCSRDLYPNWIITDNRFPNECEAIKTRGGLLIRINRNYDVVPDANGNPMKVKKVGIQHESETALDDYVGFDYVIENNKGIPELIEKVKEILIKEKII